MDAHTVMGEWDESPFDGGFDGLRDLQSRGFSGAVESGGTWLFFHDGDPLAVVEDLDVDPRRGDVEAFEDAGGRLHEATNPSTATLAAMLALDGDVRGQYFTEDTPLSTVHETLSEGGFTGYVELSENVLSGDYYVVYEDGVETYLGILGSSQRLITDDEAQSKAEGEVGIYSVVAVTFPDVELPGAEPSTADAGGTTVAAGSAGIPGDRDDPTPGDTEIGGSDSAPAAGAESDLDTDTGSETPTDEEETGPTGESGAGAAEGSAEPLGTEESGPQADPEPEPETDPEVTAEPGSESDAESQSAAAAAGETAGESSGTEPDEETGRDDEPGGLEEPDGHDDSAEPDDTGSTDGFEPVPSGDDRVDTEDASSDPVLEGVTTRSVPSLDPERTGRAESVSSESAGGRSGSRTERTETSGAGPAVGGSGRRESEPEPEPETETDADAQPEAEPEPAADSGPPATTDDDRVEAVREEYESRIQELESELQSLREERDRLQDRVSQLESTASSAAGGSGPALSPAEALAGTSLFVREGTRGEATLEDAHAGRTDRETLANNLRIEYHTQFDDDGATVDGEPFDSWLRSSAPYDFVEWLIQDLLFEIQSTGSSGDLRTLYDAIPVIDRIGFQDSIDVGEGEEGREIAFDVVARDRMGAPLFVADIDEDREPTRAESLQPLITDAEDVSMDHESLAATFSVTSSYFEPDALDAAREATSGSLLGRDKYRSYVKLARKNGFHLCLVESREESFHLAVPEL